LKNGYYVCERIKDDSYLGQKLIKKQINLKPKKMNSNFTYLRNLISVVLLSVSFSAASAQTTESVNPGISNVKATIVNNNIVLNWNVTDALASNMCEVQASKDGKNFSTIGLVMGPDPKQTNNGFAFKQNLSKMKAGQVYYRVVSVGANANGGTSNVVKSTI
jgi:hypothetical protein